MWLKWAHLYGWTQWDFVRWAKYISFWEQQGLLSIWETREGARDGRDIQKKKWKGHKTQFYKFCRFAQVPSAAHGHWYCCLSPDCWNPDSLKGCWLHICPGRAGTWMGACSNIILIHAHNRREFPPSAPPSIPTQFHLFSSENFKKRKGVVIYP